MSASTVFHLMPRATWLAWPTHQPYVPASMASEGFIHASTHEQLAASAQRYYAGQDVVALQVRTAGLDVRFEPAVPPPNASEASARPRTPGLFPHIYEAIPPTAIERVVPLQQGADGSFNVLFDEAVTRADQRFGRCNERKLTFLGVTRSVFVGGAGPAVVIMHEIPGLHPGVFTFAERCIDAGFSVYLPSMFGVPGQAVTAAYTAQSLARACVSREFSVWATDRNSPMVDWLRQLARLAHHERGGPGVGAIGMCLTGGFALGMMVEPAVIAPALSQPSLPFAVSAKQRSAVGIDDATLQHVCARAEREQLSVLGMRFTGDVMVPSARFASLQQALGARFIAIEIDSSSGNPHGVPRTAHSVLTLHFVDRADHPTYQALHQLIEFFQQRLQPTTQAC